MNKRNEVFHIPALLQTAVDFLNIKKGKLYLDATVGGGGHTLEILKRGGKVIGLDCDPVAIDFTKERLKKDCPGASWTLIKGNFVNLEALLKENNIQSVEGIIFDLGTSFYQLKKSKRGFSFSIDEPLDMRMDPQLTIKAADLINALGRKELYEIFISFGEEKLALPIAKAIVLARSRGPIKTTKQLSNLIEDIYKRKKHLRRKIHPATKVFQALRIAVNDELNNLKKSLPQALKILKKGGRLVVISFHGLEDRIVKNFFKEQQKIGVLKIITKKPVVPTIEEKKLNPHCRSAKLRCGEKI